MSPIYMIPTSLNSMGHSYNISRALDLIAGFPLHVTWESRPTAHQRSRYFASHDDLTITLSAGNVVGNDNSVLTAVIVKCPEVSAKLLIPTEKPIILKSPEHAFHAVRDLYLMAPYKAIREILHSAYENPSLGRAANGISDLISCALSGEKTLLEEVRRKMGQPILNHFGGHLNCAGRIPRLTIHEADKDLPIQAPLPESVLALPQFGRILIDDDKSQGMLVATMSARHWIAIPQNPDPMRILEAHPALLRIAPLFER